MRYAFAALLGVLVLNTNNLSMGQAPANPTQVQVEKDGSNPLYRLNVYLVGHSTQAMNYRHRGGETKLDFKGTPFLPESRGEATVQSKDGYVEIQAEFEKVQPATRFGPEFLTYVMWAISPQGRATNLGELVLDGDNGELKVTSELQTFAMIVTAEPYFAVTQPSDVVVMENVFRKSKNTVEDVDAKYELMKRGVYTANVAPADLKALPKDKKTPLDLLEARNAVRIATWAGADAHAADSFAKAKALLQEAENAHTNKKSSKTITTPAREAAQTAEDARMIALKRIEDGRVAEERRIQAEKATAAQNAAAAAQNAAAAAQAAAAEEARNRAAAQQSAAIAQAAARVAQEEQLKQAELRARAEVEESAARTREAEAKARTELALREARDAESRAQFARNQAAVTAEKAERDKAELRAQLQRQLSIVLETRDSARGLIVNLSDVLFDLNKYTLRPEAREKLAKVSGIILAHSGLALEIEGHTDDTGSDSYNQTLSERRAEAVQSYLMQQGLSRGIILATRGFGESRPIVSNDSEGNRQRNRRVELVVTGEAIGKPTSVSQR